MTKQSNTKDMLGRSQLTPVDKAREIFLDHLPDTVSETDTIRIEDGLGRITAENIQSPENLPAFSRSSMDGYAVSARDTYGASESMPAYIEVKGEVLMGEMPVGKVEKGCSFKIPTGGVVPDGADSVVMFEHTVPVDETLIEVVKSVGEGGNINRPGDDIAKGDCAVALGTKLRAQELGLLAGLGLAEVAVYRKVKIGILSTGDEIIDHTDKLTPGKIRNINSLTLAAQASSNCTEITDYGIVSDDKAIFLKTVQKAVDDNDIVLFSGGSSVGMRDLGEQVIEQLGPPGVLVHGTALKPGKPIILGMSDKTAIVGLPGHPVSAMTCFDLFVAPAIEQLSGKKKRTEHLPYIEAELTRSHNSAAGRRDVVRVSLESREGKIFATPVLGKSGSISVLSKADGYFIIDEPSQGITDGETIKVYCYMD